MIPGQRPKALIYHGAMELQPEQLICGYPDQWRVFQERHEKFLERLGQLKTTLDLAFIRPFSSSGSEDRVIFTMGRLCTEDFWEIALLCANGYGFGALKLLRSLYELAVTMAYLCENPSEVDAFLNYHWIAQHRLLEALKHSFGHDLVPKQFIYQVEQAYAKYKKDYFITFCSKCDKKRVNYTWSKLDIVSMAQKTAFGELVIPGYYEPMMHAHSTVNALLPRIEETDGGGFGFNPDSQPKEADRALMTAHNVILGVMDLQKKFFELGVLEEPLQTCLQDFVEVWKDRDSKSHAPTTPQKNERPNR